MIKRGKSLAELALDAVEEHEEKFREAGVAHTYIDWETPAGSGRDGAPLYWHPEEGLWKTKGGAEYPTVREYLRGWARPYPVCCFALKQLTGKNWRSPEYDALFGRM